QPLDPVLSGDRLVEMEFQLGRALQAQAGSDLPPQKRRRAFEGAAGVSAALFVAERRVVDMRLLQIGRHLNARERYEADAGIVHLARDQQGELAPNLLA